jgi:hypothetical protein
MKFLNLPFFSAVSVTTLPESISAVGIVSTSVAEATPQETVNKDKIINRFSVIVLKIYNYGCKIRKNY